MQDWVIFLMGLLLSIPLSILGNLVTPSVKSYIDKSSLSSRKKRIETLLREYKFIKFMKENPKEFGYYITTTIADGLYLLASLVLVVAVDIIIVMVQLVYPASNFFWSAIIVTFVWGIATYLAFKAGKGIVNDIGKFDSYQERTTREIIRLGGSATDLEETVKKDSPVTEESK